MLKPTEEEKEGGSGVAVNDAKSGLGYCGHCDKITEYFRSGVVEHMYLVCHSCKHNFLPATKGFLLLSEHMPRVFVLTETVYVVASEAEDSDLVPDEAKAEIRTLLSLV